MRAQNGLGERTGRGPRASGWSRFGRLGAGLAAAASAHAWGRRAFGKLRLRRAPQPSARAHPAAAPAWDPPLARRNFKFAIVSLAIAAAGLGLGCRTAAVASGSPAAPEVVVISLDDTVQPISADYLVRGLNLAARQHAAAALIEMNTPGGLLVSMRRMVGAILASPVPVIVYVAPAGARAGSAGFFLLEAAEIAAMAPGTNAGASHPVVEGAKIGDIMKQKLVNDATALLRSYVARRGRNVQAADEAVSQSKSYSDAEALKLHLIDLIAPNRTSLLNMLDGRTVTRLNGEKQTLHTRDARVVEVQPTLRDKILDPLTNPNLAVLILVVGALLIYVEFHMPGAVIPGAVGAVLVLLALFSLNMLPLRYTAVLLLIAAFVFLALEAHFGTHGILAAVGIVCLVIGALTLVAGPIPQMRVHLSTALSLGVGFGLITAFLLRLVVRSQRNKMKMGGEALIGEIALVTQPLAPNGTVTIHGEIWQAEAESPVASGEQVRVRALRDLTLLVERIP